MKLLLALLVATAPLVPLTEDLAAPPQVAEQEEQKPPRLDEALYDHFGAGVLDGSPWVAVETAIANPGKYTEGTVRLRGAVTAVCQTKGCWMHLGSEKQPVMVKFKDYAFFVPKDGAGRVAVVEGKLEFVQETLEQTRHYLEDAGRHEEAAKVTEGRKIYTLMASGVALRKPAKKLDAEKFDLFGEPLLEGPALELAALLEAPDERLNRTIRLRGPISAVCQTKGCWMHLGSAERPVMVKFQDYAFFVPKNASGRTALVEGTFSVRQETLEQTRHYLEDAGRHEEAAKVTEGRKIYFFMAVGAALEKVND